MRPRPWTLLLAVAALALEAAGLAVAAVASTVDTFSGQSYHQNSGIALSFLAYLAAILAALVGRGVFRVSQWSRTPALYIQLLVGTTGVYLLQDHHLDWGLPALLVAIVGFLGVCLPASWRILSRPGLEEREELAAQAAAEAEPEPVPPAPRKKASTRRR
jgi:MFS family permease